MSVIICLPFRSSVLERCQNSVNSLKIINVYNYLKASSSEINAIVNQNLFCKVEIGVAFCIQWKHPANTVSKSKRKNLCKCFVKSGPAFSIENLNPHQANPLWYTLLEKRTPETRPIKGSISRRFISTLKIIWTVMNWKILTEF